MNDLKEYILKNINVNESTRRQITEYLLDIHDFNSFDDFKDLITTMIEVDQFQLYYNDKIIEKIRLVFMQELFPKNQIKEFIKNYLQEGIPLGEKYSFYYTLYQNFKESKYFNFPIIEDELKEICFLRLKKFVDSKEKNLTNCSNLYYLCRDSVDSQNHVILQERAHQLMRQYTENYPWDYIDSLIRPYGTPIYRVSNPTFTIEPFVEKTFQGWDGFWKFLNDFKLKIQDVDKSEKFTKYYSFFIRFKDNRYKPVWIPDKEWDKYAIDELVVEKGWPVH